MRSVVVVTSWVLLAGCSLLEPPRMASCTVSRDEDAGTATVTCPDGTSSVLHDGQDGVPGEPGAAGPAGLQGEQGAPGDAGRDGTSCTVTDNGNGTKTVQCADGTSALLTDGQAGRDGSSCTASRDADAGTVTVTCDDGTSATVSDGRDGHDGVNGQDGQPGAAGSSCTVVHDGGISLIRCDDGTTAALPQGAADAGGATLTLEPPGPNCPNGGVAIQGGTTTQYACNAVPVVLFSVVTHAAEGVTYREATVGGELAQPVGEVILGRGVCYGTAPGVNLGGVCASVAGGTGAFEVALTGLTPGATYHVRAFVTGLSGTALGNEVSFQTLAQRTPVLSTAPAVNVSTNAARSGGEVTDDGGLAVLSRGLCWGTSPSPTMTDSKVLAGSGAGAFTADATGLLPGTTYYARAFATNGQGTGYGPEIRFTTVSLPLAVLSSSAPTAVSYRSATAGGSITSDEGTPVVARGVVYSTAPNPTRADSSVFTGAGIGTFTANLAGLTPSTTYYVRAWAQNGGGTVYGDEKVFTTLGLTVPTVTTSAVGGVGNTTANSGGNVTDDGGNTVTARGVCWSTAPLPTLAGSCSSDGSGKGIFSSILGGLSAATAYYARAYATNVSGTAYGAQQTFTTTNVVLPSSVPVVGTRSVSVLTGTTASSGGYVSQDGGASVTARGVCWSLTSSPTLSDTCTVDGSGTGAFSSTLAGLSGCGVTYNVRAYATNANGTGYGLNMTVTTGAIPTVTTDPVTNVSATSGDTGGVVLDDGGCAVTERGVVWGPATDPSTANFKVTSGSGVGSYSTALAGLPSNLTLYARAFATNVKGTSYGVNRIFVTLVPPGLYVGQSYQGGLIYRLDQSGQHGLVITLADVATPWSNTEAGANPCANSAAFTSPLDGMGAANTAAVIANCTVSNSRGERACDDAVVGGFTDWFLPSRDEIREAVDALYPIGLGDFITSTNKNGVYRTSNWVTTTSGGYSGDYAGGIRILPTWWATSTTNLGGVGVRCIRGF